MELRGRLALVVVVVAASWSLAGRASAQSFPSPCANYTSDAYNTWTCTDWHQIGWTDNGIQIYDAIATQTQNGVIVGQFVFFEIANQTDQYACVHGYVKVTCADGSSFTDGTLVGGDVDPHGIVPAPAAIGECGRKDSGDSPWLAVSRIELVGFLFNTSPTDACVTTTCDTRVVGQPEYRPDQDPSCAADRTAAGSVGATDGDTGNNGTDTGSIGASNTGDGTSDGTTSTNGGTGTDTIDVPCTDCSAGGTTALDPYWQSIADGSAAIGHGLELGARMHGRGTFEYQFGMGAAKLSVGWGHEWFFHGMLALRFYRWSAGMHDRGVELAVRSTFDGGLGSGHSDTSVRLSPEVRYWYGWLGAGVYADYMPLGNDLLQNDGRFLPGIEASLALAGAAKKPGNVVVTARWSPWAGGVPQAIEVRARYGIVGVAYTYEHVGLPYTDETQHELMMVFGTTLGSAPYRPRRVARRPVEPARVEASSGEVVDRDGDGIDDARDHCPDDAERVNGLADDDGCPDDPDSDRDGVSDSSDQCPAEAEDKDGDTDENGCPE